MEPIMKLGKVGSRVGFYNPYTYQPLMQTYYMGRPAPADVQKAAAENPAAAAHIVSVWQFMTWLNQSFPDLYARLSPRQKDAAGVVISGEISPKMSATRAAPISGKLGKYVNGLGSIAGTFDDEGMPDYTPPAESPVSQWGQTVSDLLSKYLVYDQQKRLIDLNIKRAEQGLPPIDSTMYGAGVSVGMSPGVQQFAYIALGGLVIVGILSAFSKARR